MAAPSDSARQGTNVTTAAATWNINVGSPSSGTLLIVFVRAAAAPGAVTFSGYTPLVDGDTSDASDDSTFIYYRWADGTEGATDVWDPTNTIKGAAICWEITGARNPSSLVPVVSTVAVGTTSANTADPGGVTLPLGSQEALFLAMAAGDGEVGAYTDVPGSYSNLTVANSGTGAAAATNCFMGGASRQLTTDSTDPGAFTHGAHTNGWSAYTVAIYPAVVTFRSDVIFPVTFGAVVSGTVYSPPETFYGQVVSPFTFTAVDAGKVEVKGQTTEAFTFGSVTTGTRALRSQASLEVTFGSVVSGRLDARSSTLGDFVWDAVTAGDISGGGADWFGEVVTPLTWDAVSSGHLAQLAHPTADSVDGTWTTQDGGSDLEGALDEPAYDDADYIRSELNPDTSATRLKLEGLNDPAVSTGHVLRWRIAKDAAGGATVSITATLRQGGGDVLGAGTEIATFTRSDVSEAFTSYEEHLSGAQADAITDYSDLYLELVGDVA